MNRLAIWIARREVVSAGWKNSEPEIVHRVPRAADVSARAALRNALSAIPAELHDADVRIVLSCGDVACADCFETPFRAESEIEATAASLAEGRCAGETAEELAIAIRQATQTPQGSLVHAVAIRHADLNELRSQIQASLPRAKLTLIAAALPLLAHSITSDGMYVVDAKSAGETLGVSIRNGVAESWKSVPRDCSGDEASISHATIPLRGKGRLQAPAEEAVLFAALNCNPAQTLNLLAVAADARMANAGRLRSAWMRTAIAAIFLSCAAGLTFDLEAKRAERALAVVEEKEKSLWQQYLPGKPFALGALQGSMTKILADRAKGEGASQYPSALSFWSEVAANLPNPNHVGLSIESVQFSHDGGRLVGRVDKANDDVLKYASLLEAYLNRSKQLQAQGEFEAREKEIVVRLRMTYEPSKAAGGVQ